MREKPGGTRTQRDARVVLGIIMCLVMVTTVLSVTLSMNASAQVTEEWIVRYNGPTSGDDGAWDIAVGSSGNVYVTGSSSPSKTVYKQDYATIAYDPSGNEIWVTKYNGPGNDSDVPFAITVGSSGNVYVTGCSQGNGTDWDYATIAYDSMGNELWVARYDGPGNGNDYARAMAVDSSGNVYVTGHSQGIGTGHDYASVAYDSYGNELWVARYNGPSNTFDLAEAISVDASGNVYVTGNSQGNGTGSDYATVAYDSYGNELWVARYTGYGNGPDGAEAISVDASGNVYVTGSSQTYVADSDYVTMKYSQGPSHEPTMDIDPDTLNLNSKGRWITAYLTTENAKAEDIDPSSLLLNDVIPPTWWNIQSETTLMVKFDRAAVQAILPVGSLVDIKVTGQWKDGEVFELHDTIRVIDVGGHREIPLLSDFREGLSSHFREEHEVSPPIADPIEGFGLRFQRRLVCQ